MLAQGNALGFGIDRRALKGRRNPLRPFRAEDVLGIRPRGVAPGWHAPRRWRVNRAEFSIGENCYKAICEFRKFELLLRVRTNEPAAGLYCRAAVAAEGAFQRIKTLYLELYQGFGANR
jgi:hypothetical protein